ncbi:hypothetical protein DV515_00007238 [Chloebia gouldiae]|uniref:Uncharacterized protein n=1 Tax=Chloebia gouldiae TaxID=44316 RepID=A0A3L8SIU9_CHLGU|nr:hypothetical protein DV515_00007238 [Chloebia gouldiae]
MASSSSRGKKIKVDTWKKDQEYVPVGLKTEVDEQPSNMARIPYFMQANGSVLKDVLSCNFHTEPVGDVTGFSRTFFPAQKCSLACRSESMWDKFNKLIPEVLYPISECVLPGAIQPKPPQLFVQYLVQILGGWENQNRANAALEKEQLEPADNGEHFFRAAELGPGTET